MENIYLKTTVSELKLKSPNDQVIPSRGRMIAEALIPALNFSICELFFIRLVENIECITRTNTTMFICENKRALSRRYPNSLPRTFSPIRHDELLSALKGVMPEF